MWGASDRSAVRLPCNRRHDRPSTGRRRVYTSHLSGRDMPSKESVRGMLPVCPFAGESAFCLLLSYTNRCKMKTARQRMTLVDVSNSTLLFARRWASRSVHQWNLPILACPMDPNYDVLVVSIRHRRPATKDYGIGPSCLSVNAQRVARDPCGGL